MAITITNYSGIVAAAVATTDVLYTVPAGKRAKVYFNCGTRPAAAALTVVYSVEGTIVSSNYNNCVKATTSACSTKLIAGEDTVLSATYVSADSGAALHEHPTATNKLASVIATNGASAHLGQVAAWFSVGTVITGAMMIAKDRGVILEVGETVSIESSVASTNCSYSYSFKVIEEDI